MRFEEIIPGLLKGKRYRRPDSCYIPGDSHYDMIYGPDGYIVVWTKYHDIYRADGFSVNQDWEDMFLLTTDDLLAEDWEEYED